MDGKLFIPYVNLNGTGSVDGDTHLYNSGTLSTEERNINDTSSGVNVVLWDMLYYPLDALVDNEGIIQNPSNIRYARTNPKFSTTFAIHFNFGTNNSHMNPSEQSPLPTQGTYDHIDILPLQMRYRVNEDEADTEAPYTTHDDSSDHYVEIKQEDVNFSFECMSRAIPTRPNGILDSQRNTWSTFNDQPGDEQGLLYGIVLGNTGHQYNLPTIHIDDTIGRTRFMVEQLKNYHQDCGFGSDNWFGAFNNRTDSNLLYHKKYRDMQPNGQIDITGLNYSVLMRHMIAMTRSMNFGNGYTWNPTYNGNQVSLNSLMWGFPDISYDMGSIYWPGCPDTKPWYPNQAYVAALANGYDISNAQFAVFNRLTFISRRYTYGEIWDYGTYEGGNRLGEFDFWFGDIGANYAAQKGLMGCHNYSDHGLFIFNNADGGDIGKSDKFNFMIVPSFYELNTAIDIIGNNNSSGTIKYRFRNHGDIGMEDGHDTYDKINGLERYQNPQRDPAYYDPGISTPYDFYTQQKALQIYQLGNQPAEWGPDNYSPF